MYPIRMALLLATLSMSTAQATQQRSFVASTGNDANSCTLVAPCRSFAAALAQTNDSGEIIVVDSAGYGPVAIAKNVKIIAPPGIYAGITVTSGTGIDVTAPVAVHLRGLTLNGQGGAIGISANAETQNNAIYDNTPSDVVGGALTPVGLQ